MIINSSSKLANFYFFKYGFLSFPLSFLGIPLYMYVPKFYNDYYDISLAKIGFILFIFRILDAFIDPILGFISDKFHLTQKKYFILFGIGLIIFFNGFFHVPSSFSKDAILLWFGFCTIFVYLFFSLIFINYYNLGIRLANEESTRIKISSFREFLGFSGMIFACVTPSLFLRYLDGDLSSFIVYGIIFAMLLISAIFLLPGFAMVNNDIS